MKAFTRAQYDNQAIKAIIDAPQMRYFKGNEETSKLQGQEKYDSIAALSNSYPQLVLVEDFLNGFIIGSSTLTGSAQCSSAMQGMIYYGFQMAENRQVYLPSQSMTFVIAYQKFQAQLSLFYA